MSGLRDALERVAALVVYGLGCLALAGLLAGVLVFLGYAFEVATNGGCR